MRAAARNRAERSREARRRERADRCRQAATHRRASGLEEEKNGLGLLARLDTDGVKFVENASEIVGGTEGYIRLVVEGGVEVYLPRLGLIDVVKETIRLEKRETSLLKEIEKLETRLNGKGFVGKAPQAVVDKALAALADLKDQLSKVREGLKEVAVSPEGFV